MQKGLTEHPFKKSFARHNRFVTGEQIKKKKSLSKNDSQSRQSFHSKDNEKIEKDVSAKKLNLKQASKVFQRQFSDPTKNVRSLKRVVSEPKQINIRHSSKLNIDSAIANSNYLKLGKAKKDQQTHLLKIDLKRYSEAKQQNNEMRVTGPERNSLSQRKIFRAHSTSAQKLQRNLDQQPLSKQPQKDKLKISKPHKLPKLSFGRNAFQNTLTEFKYSEIDERNCSRSEFNSKLFQICRRMGGLKMSVSESGIIVFYAIDSHFSEVGNQEFLTFEQFQQRAKLLEKLKVNPFYCNFVLLKYFKKWKSVLKVFIIDKTKKEINKLEQHYDRTSYLSLLKYRALIIESYLEEYANQQIIVVKNFQSLKLNVDEYKQEVLKILNKALAKAKRNELMKRLLVDFIAYLRKSFSTQLRSSHHLASSGQSSYENYAFRCKIQSGKKLLKKILYMEEEARFNLLINLLQELEKKININFSNYCKLFLQKDYPQGTPQARKLDSSQIKQKKKNLKSSQKSVRIPSQQFKNQQHSVQRGLANPLHKQKVSSNKKVKVKFQHLHDSSSDDSQTKSLMSQADKKSSLSKKYLTSVHELHQIDNNKIVQEIDNFVDSFNENFRIPTGITQLLISAQKSKQNLSEVKHQIPINRQLPLKFEEHQLRFVPFFIPISDSQFNVKAQQSEERKQQQGNSVSFEKTMTLTEKMTQSRIFEEVNSMIYKITIKLMEEMGLPLNLSKAKHTSNQSFETLFNLLSSHQETKSQQLIDKFYSNLQFVNEMALSDQISRKQFQIINEVIKSVDEYHFGNLFYLHRTQIQKTRDNILRTIQINFREFKTIKKLIIEVFNQIKDKIIDYENLFRISDYYQRVTKFLSTIENASKQIRIGNFILSIESIIETIIRVLNETKARLLSETPEKFERVYEQTNEKLQCYNKQISLTCWILSEFIRSYKKSLEFKKESTTISREHVEVLHNYLVLISISSPKMHEAYYIKYLELKDLYEKISTKIVKFEQSISKKLKLLQPQKQQLIKHIQKQLDLIIKKLFAATQKSVLVVDKCQKQVTELSDLIQHHEQTINDLQLIKDLQVTHCLKQSNQTHFHSFGKTKNEINFILKLLKSYNEFVTRFQAQMELNFRLFKSDQFMQMLQRQRTKIKHGNRVLYQFQTFIINCYALYDKFKSTLQLISLLNKLQNEELQSITSNKEFFKFKTTPVYTGSMVMKLQFSQTQIQEMTTILRKKEFTKNFIKTLNQIEIEVSKLKFQVKESQPLQEKIISNIQENLNLTEALINKVSSLKQNKWLYSLNNEALGTVSKIQRVYKLLIQINQVHTGYLDLKKFQKNTSLQSLNFKSLMPNQNIFVELFQSKKNLWKSLIQTLQNTYVDHITNYFMEKVTLVLAELKASMEKQRGLFAAFIIKGKQDCPLLHLFEDHMILSILTTPTCYFTLSFPFVQKAVFVQKSKILYLQIQTIYGQLLNVEISRTSENLKKSKKHQNQQSIQVEKSFEKTQTQEEKSQLLQSNMSKQIKSSFEGQMQNMRNENPAQVGPSKEYNLQKMLKLIKKQIKSLFFSQNICASHHREIQLSSDGQNRPLLSIVYISDQLLMLQKLNECILAPNHEFTKAAQQMIEKQIQQVLNRYNSFSNDLTKYGKNLTTILLMSRMELRNKVSFLSSETWASDQFCSIITQSFNYSFSEDKSEINFSCFNQKTSIFYEMVDCMNNTAIDPITERVYICLFNSFLKDKCGVVEDSKNLLNLSSKILKSPFNYVFRLKNQTNLVDQVQNLIKIGIDQKMLFIVEGLEKLPDFQFLQFCSSIFKELSNLKNTESNPFMIERFEQKDIFRNTKKQKLQPAIFCPSIFIESKKFYRKLQKNEIQFPLIEMITGFRLIQYCKPSISFLFKLMCKQRKVELDDDLKFYIIEKFRQLQVKIQQKRNYFISRQNIQSALSSILSIYEQTYQFDEDSIQNYFKLFDQGEKEQAKSLSSIPINLKTMKQYKRRQFKKPRIYKPTKSNYPQFIDLCNSIKKSPKLVQLFKQFHQIVEKQQNSSIILFGKSFTGKTTFYKKYFEFMNKPLSSQKSLAHIFSYTVHQISQMLSDQYASIELYNDECVKKIVEEKEINTNTFIVLKDVPKYCSQRIQNFVVRRKIVLKSLQSLSLQNVSIIIQTQSLSQLTPNIVFQCQKIYFTESTVEWIQFLYERGIKATQKLFKPQKSKEIKFSENNKKVDKKSLALIEQNISQKNLPYDQNSKKTHPLQIFSIVFGSFFKSIDFKKFFLIQVTEKHLISSTLSLFEGLLTLYEPNINEIFCSEQFSNSDKEIFIRKLFIYSFYSTCYWLIEKASLKNFDLILKQNLLRNNLLFKQIKFAHFLFFSKSSLSFAHFKQFDQHFEELKEFYSNKEEKLRLQPDKTINISEQMFVESYESKVYEYFIRILSTSQTSILFFGGSKIGKSALIKHYLRNHTKNHVIMQLIDPFKSCSKAINDILQMKNQAEKNKVAEQIKDKLIQFSKSEVSTKKLILRKNSFCEQKGSKHNIKSVKNIKTSSRNIESQERKQGRKCEVNEISYIFLEDINITSQFCQFLSEFIRQNKKTPLLKKQMPLAMRLNEQFIDQNIYTEVGKTCFIREASQIQVRNETIEKLQHYYPLYVQFLSQTHCEEILEYCFQKVVKISILDSEQSNGILKNRASILKSLNKFYEQLKIFYFAENTNQAHMMTSKKLNRFSKFYFHDFLTLFKHVLNLNPKTQFDFVQSLRYSSKLFLSFRLTNKSDEEKFSTIANRFFLSLTQGMNSKLLNSFSQQLLDSNKDLSLSNKKEEKVQKEYDDIIMKKVQYQNKHKNFKLSKNIIRSLNKIKESIQNNLTNFLIVNKAETQEIYSFMDFSFEWLDYKNILKVSSQNELVDFFTHKQKHFNLLDLNYIKSSSHDNRGKTILSNEAVPSVIKDNLFIIFVKFQDFEKWSSLVESLNYYLFELDYANKIFLRSDFKIILEYSELEERSMKTIQLYAKKLIANSLIVYLNVTSEVQFTVENICRSFIKNERFNGDYQKAIQMSKQIILVYQNLQKIINSLQKDEYTFEIKKYLFSEQNLNRFISSFIDIYYLTEVQLKISIDLINSGVGDISILLQEFAYKKVTHKSTKKELYQTKNKLQALKDRKKTLEEQIQYFFCTDNYRRKREFLSKIDRKRQEITRLNDKKQSLKHKSNQYANFLTRNELAELKYLFLNSYQIYREVFEAITFLVTQEENEAAIKKVLLDINLLSKLKEVSFNNKSQKTLLYISEKFNSFFKQKEDKTHTLNVFLWIYYTNEYYLSKITNKKNIQSIESQIAAMRSQIEVIQSEGQISQKQKLIESLYDPIQQYTLKLKQLTKKIQEIEELLKLENQVVTIQNFSQISKNIKTNFQKEYHLLVLSTFAIAIWVNFTSSLLEINKQSDSSFIQNFEKAVMEFLYKKLNVQSFQNKQELVEFLKQKVQFFLYFFQSVVNNGISSTEKGDVEVNLAKRQSPEKSTLRQKLDDNDISRTGQRSHLMVKTIQRSENLKISKEVRQKLLLIQYLIKKKQCYNPIIVDNENYLLSTFSVKQLQEIEFNLVEKKQKSHGLFSNHSDDKSTTVMPIPKIKGQLLLNSKLSFLDAQLLILLIFVKDQEWMLSSQITEEKDRKKHIKIQIGNQSYQSFISVPENKNLSIIYCKKKVKNICQRMYKYQIISFGGSSNSHQKQLVTFRLMNHIYPFVSISKMCSIFQASGENISKINKQILQLQNSSEYMQKYFKQNVSMLQILISHLRILQENHKFLCNGKKKLSIYEKNHLIQFYDRINVWKKYFSMHSIYQDLLSTYRRFCEVFYQKISSNLIQICKITLKLGKCFSKVQVNKGLTSQLESIYIHRQNRFFEILNYLDLAFEQFKKKYGTNKNQQINLPWVQNMVSVLQNYVFDRIKQQQDSAYTVILTYLKIFTSRANQVSVIDIKNLFHQNSLYSQLSSSLNCKVGSIYIENLKNLPGNKFELETFMRKFVKQIKNSQSKLRFGDNLNIQSFIQNYQYESRLIIKKSSKGLQQQAEAPRMKKLAYFDELLLKKQLIPEQFYTEIYLKSKSDVNRCSKNESLIGQQIQEQAGNIQSKIQSITQYKSRQRAQVGLYFGVVSYWHQLILQLCDLTENTAQIGIVCLSNKQDLISKHLQSHSEKQKLTLLFDYRYETQIGQQNKRTKLKPQFNCCKLKFIQEYLSLNSRNIIIFADDRLHGLYHLLKSSLSGNTGCNIKNENERSYSSSICYSAKLIISRVLQLSLGIDLQVILEGGVRNQSSYHSTEAKDSSPSSLSNSKRYSEQIMHKNFKTTSKLFTFQSIIGQIHKKYSNQKQQNQKKITNIRLHRAISQLVQLFQQENYYYQYELYFKVLNALLDIRRHLKSRWKKSMKLQKDSNPAFSLDVVETGIHQVSLNKNMREHSDEKHGNSSQLKFPFKKFLEKYLLTKANSKIYYSILIGNQNMKQQQSLESILAVTLGLQSPNQKQIKQMQNSRQIKTQQLGLQKQIQNCSSQENIKRQIFLVNDQKRQSPSIKIKTKTNYPKKISKLFQQYEQSVYSMQIEKIMSLISKSKFKILSMFQKTSPQLNENIQQTISESSKSDSIKQKSEENAEIRRAENKMLRNQQKSRSAKSSDRHLTRASIHQKMTQKFNTLEKRVSNVKMEFDDQTYNYRIGLKKLAQNFVKQESMNRQVINSPFVLRRRCKNASYFQPVDVDESQKYDQQKIPLDSNNLQQFQKEKVKNITSYEFYSKKQGKIIELILDCYQKLKLYGSIKTGRIQIKEEMIFLKQEYQRYGSRQTKHQQNWNSFPHNQKTNGSFQSENDGLLHESSEKTYEIWESLTQFEIDEKIVEKSKLMANYLKTYHKIKLMMMRHQQSARKNDQIISSRSDLCKNMLIVENQFDPHSNSDLWYEKVLLNIELHNELLNLRSQVTINFDESSMLRLKCSGVHERNLRNRDQPSQTSNDNLCQECYPTNKYKRREKRGSMFKSEMQSYPLISIQIKKKVYEIHILSKLNSKVIPRRRGDSQIINDNTSGNISASSQEAVSTKPSILIINRAHIRFPLVISCSRCLSQILPGNHGLSISQS